MEYLNLNDSGHWIIRSTEHELHSGDPVRVMLDGVWVPARIQLDDLTNEYIVLINGGEQIIPIIPQLDIRAVLDDIL
jgi:hypothetical protein